MKYLKLLALSTTVLLMTTACDLPGEPLKCKKELPFPNMCQQNYHYNFIEMRGALPDFAVGLMSTTFDAADFTVDLSSSNIPVTTTSGYATVVVDLSDGSRQSNSFEWIRLGDEAVVANPSAVNRSEERRVGKEWRYGGWGAG